jgi:hypothetical protein
MYLEGGQNDNGRTKARVSKFYALGATGTASAWQTWEAIPDETMAYMIIIGGGGSGAGGFTGAAGAIRGGGGGGGAAGQTRGLIPLMFLPKKLYIQPGQGGAGVAASTNGNSGNLSYVSIGPNITAANIVMQSGAAKASNTVATAGTVAAAGAGGTAETISTVILCMQGQWGILQFLAGKIGAAAGAVTGAVGLANVLFTTGCSNGGAGGASTPAGNTEFAGGAQTGAGIYTTIVGGVSGGNPGHGSGGYDTQWDAIVPYGGAGGAAGGAALSTAGDGGNGGFPGGGGGGGGGGVTGGRGGKGGDGLVVIISW